MDIVETGLFQAHNCCVIQINYTPIMCLKKYLSLTCYFLVVVCYPSFILNILDGVLFSCIHK